MEIIELPICQQKWLDIGNSMHPCTGTNRKYTALERVYVYFFKLIVAWLFIPRIMVEMYE